MGSAGAEAEASVRYEPVMLLVLCAGKAGRHRRTHALTRTRAVAGARTASVTHARPRPRHTHHTHTHTRAPLPLPLPPLAVPSSVRLSLPTHCVVHTNFPLPVHHAPTPLHSSYPFELYVQTSNVQTNLTAPLRTANGLHPATGFKTALLPRILPEPALHTQPAAVAAPTPKTDRIRPRQTAHFHPPVVPSLSHAP